MWFIYGIFWILIIISVILIQVNFIIKYMSDKRKNGKKD